MNCRVRPLAFVLLCLLLGPFLIVPSALAQTPEASAIPTAYSIQEFWNLPAEAKAQGVHLDLETYVTYADPEWGNLWLQDTQKQGAAYVPFPSKHKGLKSGQIIRIQGLTRNGEYPSLEEVELTVIGEGFPKAIPLEDKFWDFDQLTDKFIQIEALIDRVEPFNDNRLHLYLNIQGRLVFAWYRYDTTKPIPRLENTRVLLRAVYSPKRSPVNELSSLDLLIGAPELLTPITPLALDPLFDRAPVEIGELQHLSPNLSVLVRGTVVAQDRGHSLTIRDDSGQVTIQSAQTLSCSIGSHVEALGQPWVQGTSWLLTEACYRPTLRPDSISPNPVGRRIRLAAQLSELSPDQAAKGIPTFLSGVITWSHPESPFLFIQDASGGVCVYRGTDTNKVRPPGRSVEVTGITALGNFAPVITASNIRKTGDVTIPGARSISLEHAMGGTSEGHWVEMRGLLKTISTEGLWTTLGLVTSAGPFEAVLPAGSTIPGGKGAILRIQGVCTALTNDRRQIRGIRLWVPNHDNLQVELDAPRDLFDAPERTLASIGQFGAPIHDNRRVRLKGTVVYQDPGHSLYLVDRGESLLVLAEDSPTFSPGDLVETVGFLGRRGSRFVLREAAARWLERGSDPSPVSLHDTASPHPDLDGQLVSVEATLASVTELGRSSRLTFQTPSGFFESQLPGLLNTPPPPPGARLRVTGVYELKSDESGRPSGFQLLLRTQGDVVVLATPSWFTRPRILAISGGLLLAILSFLMWIIILRRRVHRQTEQIRNQLVREARLQEELQRTSKLESLGLLAGGIAHDFNNLLTVIMGNLSLGNEDPMLMPETKESLRDATLAVHRARDLTQQLLTFAKGGAPVRTATDVADIIKEVSEFSLRGSLVALDLRVEPGLPPADVDKAQFAQVIQNLVINAVQAMPTGGRLAISLCAVDLGHELSPVLEPGAYLRITLQDTGPGIAEEHLGRIFDPYFTTKKTGSGIGLATVHSIIRKHNGHISVSSRLGEGTAFKIWIPVSTGNTLLPPQQAKPGHEEKLPRLKGRVLVMDDEPDVCRLVCAMLRRLGIEATACNDGNAALQLFTEAQAAHASYDLLILDLTVPGGLGGIHVMERLLPANPDIKAIVSSGYSAELSMANFKECGFLDVVPKPYQLSDLAQVLARHLPRA